MSYNVEWGDERRRQKCKIFWIWGLKVVQFDLLILRKIDVTLVITDKMSNVKLKCTKFDFRKGFAESPLREAQSAPQTQ